MIPVAKSEFERLRDEMRDAQQQTPHFSTAWETFLDSKKIARMFGGEGPTEELWSDSITIGFGSRPLPIRAIGELSHRKRLIPEESGALVISQNPTSGALVVLLYPPSSELVKPTPPYYIAYVLDDPRMLTPRLMRRLFCTLVKLDLECSARAGLSKQGRPVSRDVEGA